MTPIVWYFTFYLRMMKIDIFQANFCGIINACTLLHNGGFSKTHYPLHGNPPGKPLIYSVGGI